MPIWAADTSIFDQLPNGGAVVAVVAVVILFLKHLEKSAETTRGIVSTFATETTAARREYREHIAAIMEQGLAAHAETRSAIRSLDSTIGAFRMAVEANRHPQESGP
jgi:hypothetical protein